MPDEAALESRLSQPTAPLVAAMAALDGDILILGVAGKMGPSLAALARRASEDAGIDRQVIGVARFSQPAVRDQLERHGIWTIPADLLDPAALRRLPESPNIIFMAGQKFGTTQDAAQTWAINALLPGRVAERFPRSRIVVFSTGNVYGLADVASDGPDESVPPAPIGEYAQSALARERIFEFHARECGTPVALLRLNYAIEPRYGVLRDIADAVLARVPVSLAMGRVNVIWQRDANAIALQMLAHVQVPPLVLNVTGRPAHRVRWIAEEFGRRLGVEPVFTGEEAATALLSNAARCEALFGPPPVTIYEMLDEVADWVRGGGRSLGRPTHFTERAGRF